MQGNPSALSRRQFMQTAALLGASAAVWPGMSFAEQNGRVRHAAIGVGNQGRYDVGAIKMSRAAEVVAICDIDARHLRAAAEAFPQARVYRDWRELLEKEHENIDSINVAVPDHMHAAITISALRRGKHIYCQKPMCHDIAECRIVAAEAERAKTVTQMGTQHASKSPDRTAEAAIQGSAIGKVTAVYAWSNRPGLEQYRPTGPRPDGADPIPDYVDWDLWLGTAPHRPYKEGVYHHTWWRGWQDFGVGWLGDMGCHIMDMPFRALKLTAPTHIRGEAEPEWVATPDRFNETWPTRQKLTYTFPGTEYTNGDTLEFIWLDGGQVPPESVHEQIANADWPTEGAVVVGTEGALLLPHGADLSLYKAGLKQSIDDYRIEGDNHWHQWAQASVNGSETRSPFGYASEVTQTVLLGTVALRRPGRTLQWNHDAMRVINDEPANALLKRTYRTGWEVEGL